MICLFLLVNLTLSVVENAEVKGIEVVIVDSGVSDFLADELMEHGIDVVDVQLASGLTLNLIVELVHGIGEEDSDGENGVNLVIIARQLFFASFTEVWANDLAKYVANGGLGSIPAPKVHQVSFLWLGVLDVVNHLLVDREDVRSGANCSRCQER